MENYDLTSAADRIRLRREMLALAVELFRSKDATATDVTEAAAQFARFAVYEPTFTATSLLGATS